VGCYIEDLQEKREYSTVLNFYRKNPEKKLENAIGSFTTVDVAELEFAATLTVSGDDTTWRRAGDKCRDRIAKDPPY
jgi:hypothetical protein